MRQRRRQNFLKGFSGRQLSKKDGGPGRQQKKGDSGGTSGEGGSALWVDSSGSGNRRKYRLKSENGAKAQSGAKIQAKTSARHKAGQDRSPGMYRDSREWTIGRGDSFFTHDGGISVRGAVPSHGGSGTKRERLFAQLEKIFRTGKRREKPVIDGAGQPFEIREIFFYQKAERAEWYDCSERGMEAMVIDFGALTQKNQDAFFRCSRCFLVGSVSGWQLADFAALAEKAKWKKWCEYFVSFGEEEAVKMAGNIWISGSGKSHCRRTR